MSIKPSQPSIDPLAALFRGELAEANRQLRFFVERDDGEPAPAAPEPLQNAVRAVTEASRVLGLPDVADLADAVARCLDEHGSVPNLDARAARAKLRDAQGYLERLERAGAHPAAFTAATSGELAALQLALAEPSRVSRPATRQIDSTLLELFRMEAERCAALLGERLVALDTQGPDSAVWEEVMRATHSLKGAARIVDLGAVAALAHMLEDCFVAAQNGALVLSSSDIDLLLLAVDAIARAGQADAQGTPAEPDEIEAAARELTPRLSALAHPAANPSPNAPAPSAAPPRSPSLSLPPALGNAAAPSSAAVLAIHSQPERTSSSLALTFVPSATALASERTNEPVQPTTTLLAPQRTSQRAPERVLRIAAESIRQLMGLASESLVESRRMTALTPVLQRVKKRQTALSELLETIDRRAGDDATRALVEEAKQEARECMRMLSEHGAELDGYTRRAEELGERLYRTALKSQMRPFADGAQGFPRLVRDGGRQLGKRARLELVGRDTEVDRDALDKLEAPINHLLRNSLDHGIEAAQERLALGKPEVALVQIEARHHAGMLSITVSDDGRGIDLEVIRQRAIVARSLSPAIAANLSRAELYEFLFLPGFSTAEVVSEISGRGVGLDVVKSAVDALGGTVRISSELGRGTSFHLLLPVTRSVIRALVATVDGDAYAFPLLRIERIERIPESAIKTLENRRYALIDGRPVVLVGVRHLLGLPEAKKQSDVNVVVVGDRKQRCGVVVDELRGEHDLVVRPLDPRLGKVQDVTAAAVLMDGSIALIADVDDIVRSAERLLQPGEAAASAPAAASATARKRVLVVDDSIAVREAQRQLLVNRGYLVDVAVDGVDGLNSARRVHYDLIISDIDMPRMNGFDLVRSIKQDAKLNAIPVVIVSYKDRDEDRLRGLEVGASCYLSKSSFHDDTLARAVSDLIGEATP
jgi:two-component system, chemotaxis family, sensor histidine kinase and response regulator WspE